MSLSAELKPWVAAPSAEIPFIAAFEFGAEQRIQAGDD
jgi:hypothetical protein